MYQTVPGAVASHGRARRVIGLVSPAGLDVCIVAVGASVVLWYLAGLLVGRLYADLSELAVPLGLIAGALGARRIRGTHGRRPNGRRHRLMPYLVAVATGLLPVAAIVQNRGDNLGLTVAALLVTALVILRQMVAQRENDRLLAELSHKEQRFRRLVRESAGAGATTRRDGTEATRDTLTGLADRAEFADRLRASVVAAGPDHRLSVVLVDLHDLRTVNDTLGPQVGDGLLLTAAQRLKAAVRPSDTVARIGGDKFAMLFEGLGGADVDGVLTRIADTLLEPAVIEGHVLSVSAGFGVVDGRGDDAGRLLREADAAMDDSTGHREGAVRRYRPGPATRGAERVRLAGELRTALAEGQLVLHYQPVVTLPAGRMTGVEALVRWQHPEQGLLGPGAFVDAAERTGLIVPLGRWVLREATRQAAAWIHEYGEHAPGSVSVNVSGWQLQDSAFAAEVAAALRDSGLPAHRLTIEITESTAIGGGATHDTLRMLRGLGVRLSLDDFGTGASTLSLLATCPVDQIKLDRSFAPVPGPDAIAVAVLQLANAFGLEAIAEGVETPAQADKLERLGYLRAQGYYFARPMAPGKLAEELKLRATPLEARP